MSIESGYRLTLMIPNEAELLLVHLIPVVHYYDREEKKMKLNLPASHKVGPERSRSRTRGQKLPSKDYLTEL